MKRNKNFSELMRYAGGHRVLTYCSFVLSAASALLALMPFVFIWLIIRDVLNAMPDFTQATRLADYGWCAVGFALGSMLVYFAALMCSHLSAFRTAGNMRCACLEHIAKLPVGAVETMGSGKMRAVVNESTAATETYLAHNLPDMAGALATPVGLLVLLFVFDWRLGLLSLLPVLVGFAVMMRMTGKRMEQKMKEYNNALSDMNNQAVEYVRGIPVVKTFSQTVYTFKKFKGSIDRYYRWVIDYTKSLMLPMVCFTVAINAVFALLIVAALCFTAGGVELPFLLNLLFYVIITPVISVTLMRVMFMSENKLIVNDALERIHSVLALKPLPDAAQPRTPADGSVEFRKVGFRYPGAEDYAVRNLSFCVPQGKKIALVGASGGGKTTAAGLISRFWDVQEGEVLLGGVNVKDIDKEELARRISYVFQDSRLLKTSVLENVRLAKPDASEEEVRRALRAAQCDDIVARLPRGLHTVIGANGVYLSGGEAQRIAVARLILKDAPVVVLDEATAFADPENELRMQRALDCLTQGKTVIVIAHRLNAVRRCDEIYVLSEGCVAESGSHGELIKHNGMYRKMFEDYQTSVEWKVAGGRA